MRLDWFNNPARSFINLIISPVQNFLKRIFKIKSMIYYSFCCRIKINWSKFNFSNWLAFFYNVAFSVIWYLKPFVSFKRSLSKSLILDLLASNCSVGSFLQLIQLCSSFHILWMHGLFLLYSLLHKKEVQKANQCFLSV